MANWKCVTCNRSMSHYGVPRHRTMHRERQDGPVVMENATHRFTYDYRPDTTSPDPEHTVACNAIWFDFGGCSCGATSPDGGGGR